MLGTIRPNFNLRVFQILALLACLLFDSPANAAHESAAEWQDQTDFVCGLIGRQYLDSALALLPPLLERANRAAAELDTAFESGTRLTLYFQYSPNYYDSSATQLMQSIHMQQSANPIDSSALANSWIDLADIYRIQARREQSVAALAEATKLLSANNSHGLDLQCKWLLVSALSAEDNSDFAKADSLATQSLNLARRIGDKTEACAHVLTALGRIKFRRGDFLDAELRLRQALDILERQGTADRVDCILALSTLNHLLVATSRHFIASVTSLRMLKYAQASTNLPPAVLSRALVAAAAVLRRAGRYVESEIYLGMARRIDQSTLGSYHPTTASDMLQMGIMYWGTKRLRESRALIDSAISIFHKSLPPDHYEFSSAYMFQASTLDYADMPDSAGALYRAALKIRIQRLGEQHPRTMDVQEFYAGHLVESGSYHDAMATLYRMFDLKLADFLRNARDLDYNEASQYLTGLRSTVDSYLQCLLSLKKPSPLETQRGAEMILRTKGLVLHDAMSRRQASDQFENSSQADEIAKLESEMLRLRFDDPRFTNWDTIYKLDSLQSRHRLLTLEAPHSDTTGRRTALVDDISPASIAAKIPPDAVLLEYYQYMHYFPVVKDSCEQRFVCVVLDRNGVRALTLTFTGMTVDSTTALAADLLAQSGSGAQDSKQLTEVLSTLYDNYWAPIDSIIGNAKLILLAPDDIQSILPFHAFIDPDGRFLIERYTFDYLTSGRDLLTIHSRKRSNSGMLAIGDADYDAAPADRLAAISGEQVEPRFARTSLRSDFRNIGIDCIPFVQTEVSRIEGTRDEISAVTKSWSAKTREPFLRFTGAAASEDICKSFVGRNRVLHFATHGYFIHESCNQPDQFHSYTNALLQAKKDVLLNSGILLAGSNLHGVGSESLDLEDGILTAGEVSALHLDGVDAAILSACESAMGNFRAGQGQMGIKQSFWGAGAKSVVSAFWVIPDALTAGYMDRLYSLSDLTLPVALRQLALEDITKFRGAGQFPTPYYWGSFHNFGDWRIKLAGN